MSNSRDVTATVVFHREGAYAIPALASLKDAIDTAKSQGITVESRAILDRPDAETRALVESCGTFLDDIATVDCGDLAVSRNEGIRLSRGKFLTFLDGDDLWGKAWIASAFEAANRDDSVIWHPEVLYYFKEQDFHCQSLTRFANPQAESFFFQHTPSNAEEVDRRQLFLENFWSANVFAARNLHLAFPYKSVDRENGFGVEDWSWNIETLNSGVRHLIVPNTVHCIRIREESLGQKNMRDGLLPYLPTSVTLHRSKSAL